MNTNPARFCFVFRDGNKGCATRRLRRFLTFLGVLGGTMLTAIQILTDPFILIILIMAMIVFSIALLVLTTITYVTLQKLLKRQTNKYVGMLRLNSSSFLKLRTLFCFAIMIAK